MEWVAQEEQVQPGARLFSFHSSSFSRRRHTTSHHFRLSESHLTLSLCDSTSAWFSYFSVFFLYPFWVGSSSFHDLNVGKPKVLKNPSHIRVSNSALWESSSISLTCTPVLRRMPKLSLDMSVYFLGILYKSLWITSQTQHAQD